MVNRLRLWSDNPFWPYVLTIMIVGLYCMLMALSPPLTQDENVFYLPVLIVPFIGVVLVLGVLGFGLSAYRVLRRTGDQRTAVAMFAVPTLLMVTVLVWSASTRVAESVEHSETFQQDGVTYRIAFPYIGGPGILYQCEGVFDLYCDVIERSTGL